MLQDITMVAVFHAALHVVLVAAILGKLLLIGGVIYQFSPSGQERIMRSIAATCGLLLYLGAKALGLSIPMFLLGALTQGGAIITGALGALMPALLGFVVAWYVTGYFNSRDARKNLVGMRVLAMVMSMAFFLYVDTYVAAVDSAHVDGFRLLLPNLTFVLAIMLFATFKYTPLEQPAAAQPSPVTAEALQAAVKAAPGAASRTAALLALALGGSLLVGTAHAQRQTLPLGYPLIPNTPGAPSPQPQSPSTWTPAPVPWLPPTLPPGYPLIQTTPAPPPPQPWMPR